MACPNGFRCWRSNSTKGLEVLVSPGGMKGLSKSAKIYIVEWTSRRKWGKKQEGGTNRYDLTIVIAYWCSVESVLQQSQSCKSWHWVNHFTVTRRTCSNYNLSLFNPVYDLYFIENYIHDLISCVMPGKTTSAISTRFCKRC